MATRTVSGTIYHPGGVTAWSNANVVFRLAYYFSIAGYTFPEETYTAVTDAAGAFTVNIAVPTTGTAQYQVLLPNGTNFYVNLAAGAAITLEDLIAIIANPTAPQNTLQTLIDAHAGIAATTAISAHVELATDAEAIAKADTARAITPSNLAALDSSETFKGLIERATVAEAQAGTDTARAVTPAGLQGMVGFLNVKGFGAVGDGVHDDTTAIQAAINAAQAATNNRGTVVIPDGVFLVSSALTIIKPITLIGNGAATIIVNGGSGNAIELGFTVGSGQPILNGVTLANFWIEGRPGSASAIYLKLVCRCTFENIFIPRCVDAGFYLHGALLNTFTNCHVSNNLPSIFPGYASIKYGIHAKYYDYGDTNLMNCNSNTFIGCIFEGIASAPGIGIYFEQKATGNIFIGGTLEGNTIGIKLDDYNYVNTFLNVHLEANGTNIVENGTSIWSNFLLSTSGADEAIYISMFHRLGLQGGASIRGNNFGDMFIEHVAGKAVYMGNANALATLFCLGNTANAGSSSYLELKGGLKTHDMVAHTDGKLYWYLGGNLAIGISNGGIFYLRDHVGSDLFFMLENGLAYFNNVVFPMQHATVGGPAYVKGGLYFDTTLNKLRVGGATAWETITSA